MVLAQINTEFKYRMNLVSNFYERLQTYNLIDTFIPVKLKSLSLKYDRLFYLSAFENTVIINNYLNSVLVILAENDMVEVETGETIAQLICPADFPLPFIDFENDLQSYFVKMDHILSKVNIVLNDYFEENETIGSMYDYHKNEENTPGNKIKTLETLERVTEKSVTLFD
ncbi:hypothetical protein JK159_06760 [Weissella minor]|uniref:hypothetical protein n=1 Tax=Weissella minor TaxID=1620 RepID=UPI001BAF5D7F|nr:hypothetical protein [Weissella minor]MBS0950061.1 hypothetical protein [Weissella minor]